MLQAVFLAPGRFLDSWGDTIRQQAERARQHPNGGCCHTCGADTSETVTECDDCYYKRQY